MGIADELVDEIFSWIKQSERCAEKLKELARELESLRKKCNVGECVGSSVSVVGGACLVGAGLATLFTGGAAAPFLGVLGATYGVTGAAVSIGSKLVELFIESDTMKDAQKLAEKISNTGKRIQKLFQQLKKMNMTMGCDEQEEYAINQILEAMAKQSGVTWPINTSTFRVDPSKLSKRMIHMQSLNLDVMAGVARILTAFTVQLAGKNKYLLRKGAQKLTKELSGAAVKAVCKGGAKVAGGAVALAFALDEAIDNWKDMVKKNHVTEASQSLKSKANEIAEASKIMKKQLDDIKKQINEIKEQHDTIKAEKSKTNNAGYVCAFVGLGIIENVLGEISQESDTSSDSDEEERWARMALLNVHSMANKAARIKQLILQNNLDVFLSTETWLYDHNGSKVLSQASPEDFGFCHQPRGTRGGGVAIQYSNEFQGHRFYLSEPMTTFEYVAMELHHRDWDAPILLINVYRPPGGNLEDYICFLGELELLFLETEHYDNVILMGDFNIHVDKVWSTQGELDVPVQGRERVTRESKFTFAVHNNGYVQRVTWPTHTHGRTLDLVMTRNVDIRNLSVRNDYISDHYTVYFDAQPTKKSKFNKKKR